MNRRIFAITALVAVLAGCAKESGADSGEKLLEKAVAAAAVAKPTAAAQAQDLGAAPDPDVAPAPDIAAAEPMAGKTLGSDASYVLTADVPAAEAGKEATVTLQLVPKEGWKINCDYPTKLSVEPPSGVKVDKPKQTKNDRVECKEHGGSKWAVKFTSEAGSKTLTGLFKFAVCTEATCDPKEKTLAIALDVK